MHITLTDEERYTRRGTEILVIYPNLVNWIMTIKDAWKKSFADVQEVEEKTPLIYLKIYMKNRIIEMNEERSNWFIR